LGKNPHDLATRCLDESNWNEPLLKSVVQRISNEEGIRADILANYIAYRLSSEQKGDWWSTAEKLQRPLGNARLIIRDIMLQYVRLEVLSYPDLELLKQTFSMDEVDIDG